ncbi:hypothetical protein OPKNFCMD_0169 [Methylobacterium crusticola]|uniref:Energy transducer TonB n=1 Tax=Methylobacterium crusticola TaxID=1697972 RepID=A0ABQ4QQ99_9HYPH|nr:hypothetical protein [Methylobacterium crusticola]GJD47461.1 hypothetical protein OPKNFCMD_0169 [Methylobacterium crusticola]
MTRLAAALALVLAGLAPQAHPARAADFDEPPPYAGLRDEGRPPPRFARPEPSETCRVFVKRRIDPDGEEVVRRVRVCDDGPAYREHGRWGGPPPWARGRPGGWGGARFERPPAPGQDPTGEGAPGEGPEPW